MAIEVRLASKSDLARRHVTGAVANATATGRTFAQFQAGACAGQMLTKLGKSSKLRRDIGHGHGSVVTNWTLRSSTRQK